MQRQNSIDILLATYNGERFLREQIDSILLQDYQHFRVLARDDGSTDDTVQILKEYQAKFPGKLKLLPTDAPSGGPQFNFLLLMEASTAEYVMFSDQDDVWNADKVSSSMRLMRDLESKWGIDGPLLTFANLSVANEDLTLKHPSYWQYVHLAPEAIWNLSSLLRQNVVTGCTALINRPLVKLALHMPANVFMHDWWIALLATIFGHASYLERPTILYRQHGSNLLGTGAGNSPGQGRHSTRAREWSRSTTQAHALLETFGSKVPLRSRRVLEDLLKISKSSSRVERVGLLLKRRYFSPGWRSNVGLAWFLWSCTPSDFE